MTETRRAARRNVTKRAATIVSTSFFLSTIGEAPLWLSMVFLAHELAAHVIPFLFVVSMGTLLASVLRATFRVADVAGSSWVMTPARVVIYVDDLAVVYSHDDEHSLYRDFIAALESRWNVEDEGELTDLIRAKRPLRASLLSLTVLGVPQSTKGELGYNDHHLQQLLLFHACKRSRAATLHPQELLFQSKRPPSAISSAPNALLLVP